MREALAGGKEAKVTVRIGALAPDVGSRINICDGGAPEVACTVVASVPPAAARPAGTLG